MHTKLALTAILLMASTLPALAGNLNALPDVDPEVQQPGMEIPREKLPPVPTRRPIDVRPLTKSAVIAPEPQRRPTVARPAPAPMTMPPVAIETRRVPVPPPRVQVPMVQVQPDPIIFVRAFFTLVNAIIAVNGRR